MSQRATFIVPGTRRPKAGYSAARSRRLASPVQSRLARHTIKVGCSVTVPVRPHVKSDGTHVRGHVRGAPNTPGTGGVVVAIGLAVAMSGISASTGTPILSPSGPRMTQNELAQTKKKYENNLGSATLRWERKGYKVKVVNRVKFDDDCSAHSYGQVHDFFLSSPCSLLTRTVFEIRDKRRNVILVAISWVDMPSAGTAEELIKLVDTDGTGNVTELSREKGRYRSVRFTGEFYESALDGSAVGNVQVQPVGPRPVDTILQEIATSALR